MMVAFFLFSIIGIVAYIAGSFFDDPEIARNFRCVGIVFYAASGCLVGGVPLLICSVFTCVWIFQTKYYWDRDKPKVDKGSDSPV